MGENVARMGKWKGTSRVLGET